MKSIVVYALCAAVNLPFALAGFAFNIFACGFCAAFAIDCIIARKAR